MKTILFQGDSITDVARSRENKDSMGMGYANMATGELGYLYPGEYKAYNRGISGNRVVDIYARWKIDCLNLKPDYLSILIGVNDVWHEIMAQNGVDAEKFEVIYDMLLNETRAALPDVKIILLEPFLLRYTATEENWEYFNEEVAKRREAVKRLAKRHGLPTIPLQDIFDEALKKAPVEFWTVDGVHPSTAGHGLMAKEWVKAFKNL